MEKVETLSKAFYNAVKRNDYTAMGDLFLADTKTDMGIRFLKTAKHFDDDVCPRDIYQITIKRGERSFSFNFGQSLTESTKYKDETTKELILLDGKFENQNKKLYPEKFKDYVNDFCVKIKGVPPTAYDILSCLTKYDVGTFEDFCCDYGYDIDSRKAEKIYNAVLEEWSNVQRIWTDAEIEALREIN